MFLYASKSWEDHSLGSPKHTPHSKAPKLWQWLGRMETSQTAAGQRRHHSPWGQTSLQCGSGWSLCLPVGSGTLSRLSVRFLSRWWLSRAPRRHGCGQGNYPSRQSLYSLWVLQTWLPKTKLQDAAAEEGEQYFLINEFFILQLFNTLQVWNNITF